MNDEPRKIESLDDLFHALNAADAHLVSASEGPLPKEGMLAEMGGARELLRLASEYLGIRKGEDLGIDRMFSRAENGLDTIEMALERLPSGQWRMTVSGEDQVDEETAVWTEEGPEIKPVAEKIRRDISGWLGP